MAIDIFDSARAANAIGCLARGSSREGERRFPINLPERLDLYVRANESIHNWFRRVTGPEGDERRISECSIETDFAFFGQVSWRDDKILQCSFQALITKESNLQDFYLQDNQPAQYYRFDLDPAKPGPLFAEPLPHIHCIPDGPPRFPLAFGQNEYCLISFLEFIFRNHFYDKWLTWVKFVSKKSLTSEELDDIIASFNNGRVQARIGDLGPLLQKLTNTLRQQKYDQVRRQLALPDICSVLNY